MVSIVIAISFAVLSLLFSPSAYGLVPSASYDHGPVPFDDHGALWYSIDRAGGTAALALRVNDSTVLPLDGPAWVGLGISEPTSGSMLGADIVTAEFGAGGDNADCELADRYVPFVPYPLIEGDVAPAAFPEKDDCQADGSWVLVRCERAEGEVVLEVTRQLSAHDDQDREIGPGGNSMLYAYGGSFQYHGGNRAALEVVLYEEEGDEIDVGMGEVGLPKDADGFVDVLATDYAVPDNQETVYACTSKKFELEGTKGRMIVALEPLLDSEIDMVHHFTLFLCNNKKYAAQTSQTTECLGTNGISGPLGNPESGCSTFVYAYAKGGSMFVVPEEAGFLVNDSETFIVVETHYDNPEAVSGNIDKSGVRVHYTNTLREHEAGALLIGDSLVSRFGETVKSQFEYEYSCPSECTKKFSREINVFGSFLHMHTTGQEIYTNKFAANGSYIDTLNKINFWSDAFQKYVLYDPPYTVRPGEHLQTTCLYDTTKRPDTKFGIETKDEMCMNFLGYWPLQRDSDIGQDLNICSFSQNEKGETFTVCGDVANVGRQSVLPGPNPSLNDTVGAPTTFGDAQDTCSTPAPLAPTVTPDVNVAEEPVQAVEESGSSDDSDASDSSDEDSEGNDGGEGDDGNEGDDGGEGGDEEEGDDEEEGGDGDDGDDGDDDENACFPASAVVALEDGSTRRMDEVQVGDSVQVGDGTFSTVFMFTHRTAEGQHRFRRVETADGHAVLLTEGHFLYVNKGLRMAREVEAGDMITLASGVQRAVTRVSWETELGLFNPQTMHGDIIVNGVLVSTYTKAIAPTCAHGLLSPLRWAYRTLGMQFSALAL